MTVTPEQVEKLKARGLISDDLYARYQERGAPVVPDPMPTPPPAPAPTPLPDEPIPTPEAAPEAFQGHGATGKWDAPAVAPAPAPEAPPVDTSRRDYLKERQRMVESSGNDRAVSPKGALGPYQFMPATYAEEATKLGIPKEQQDPFDPEQSGKVYDAYMDKLLERYHGDEKLALAAYNHGMGNVDKAIAANGGNSDFASLSQFLPKETQDYVPNVLGGAGESAPQSLQLEVLANNQKSIANAAAVSTGVQKAEIDSAYQQKMAQESEKMLGELNQRQAMRDQVLDRYRQQWEATVDQYANTNIDSSQWWSKKSTGGQVLTVIGTVLLGALSPVAGIAYMMKQVRDDVSAQEAARERLGDVAQKQQTLYSAMRQAYEDKETAAQATQAAVLKNMQIQLGAELSKYSGQEVQNKGRELDAAINENLAQIYKKTEDEKKKKLEPILLAQQRDAAMAGKIPVDAIDPKDVDRVVMNGNEVVGFAPNADEAKKLRDSQATYRPTRELLDQLIAMREKEGGVMPGMDAVPLAKYDSMIRQLQLGIKKVAGLGALNAQDYALLYGMVPPPEELVAFHPWDRMVGEDPVVARLKQTRDQFDRTFEADVSSRLVQRNQAVKAPGEVGRMLQPGFVRR